MTTSLIKQLIGSRIREARIAAGVSQRELSEYIGRSYTAVGTYERGLYLPPDDIIRKIAHRLQKKFEWFTREENHDHASI